MSNGESLKELTDRMIRAVGDRKDVAKQLSIGGRRVSENDLSQWCNKDGPRFIPLDHLLDLDALAGDIFLKQIASLRGYELARADRAVASGETAVEAAADIAKESGALVHDVLAAAHDGICPREAREIRSKMGQVFNQLHKLDGALA
jgi:hypothetical protein